MPFLNSQVVPLGVENHGKRSKYCFLSLKDLLTILVGITIPVAIGIYGAVSNVQIQNAAKKAAAEQQRIATERRIFDWEQAVEQYQQKLYKGFLDDIYTLHKDGELNDSAYPWVFANARFRAVHRQWDKTRKEQTLQFLKEKELIGRQKCSTGCEVKNVEDIIQLNGLNYDFIDISSQTGSLSQLDLRCIPFNQISMKNATFSDTNLNGVTFTKSRLTNTQFNNVTMRCALFNGTQMDGVNLKNADISGSRFIDVDPYALNLTNEQRLSVTFENTELLDQMTSTSIPMNTSGGSKTNVNLSTARWSPNGTTFVPNSDGNPIINQLRFPMGIDFDIKNEILVIADTGNARIIEWKINGTTVESVGEYLLLVDAQGIFSFPSYVAIDRSGDNLIICDQTRRQVLRQPRFNKTANFEVLINRTECIGLCLDSLDRLYITDATSGDVIRFDMGNQTGVIVAGGNGVGSRLDQLNGPHFVFVDQEYSVYVSEFYNHRVTKWMSDATQGVVVAGGHGNGISLIQLGCPEDLFVDSEGTVFVVEQNHRITRWVKGMQQGTIVVGGNSFGNGSDQFYFPISLAFDQQGHLYVSDKKNHRIQRFAIEMI